MEGYTGEGLNGFAYLQTDGFDRSFTVVTIAEFDGERFVEADLIIRIVGDQVIIERDQNDKQLVDALEQLGVPRSQIILAYAGEPVPEET
ncbi:XisI protein [bacterium]|nr:XisI protein [bacterium]